MQAIEYYAPEAFGAWAKTGYLFENGIFLCEFKYYGHPSYICREYDFHSPPQKTTWGKGVIDDRSLSQKPGAFADYQTFEKKTIVDMDFESMKKRIQDRKVPFWNEKHHLNSKEIDAFDY